MSNPSGVDPNAGHIDDQNFSVNTVSSALVEVTVWIIINNQGSQQSTVNAYLCIDGNLYDALPLFFPIGQTRQQFSMIFSGVTQGTHTASLRRGQHRKPTHQRPHLRQGDESVRCAASAKGSTMKDTKPERAELLAAEVQALKEQLGERDATILDLSDSVSALQHRHAKLDEELTSYVKGQFGLQRDLDQARAALLMKEGELARALRKGAATPQPSSFLADPKAADAASED